MNIQMEAVFNHLSIIQEEEENSVNEATPPSSRTNSRPSSIYGLNPAAIQKAYKEYKVRLRFIRNKITFNEWLKDKMKNYECCVWILGSKQLITKRNISNKRAISSW